VFLLFTGMLFLIPLLRLYSRISLLSQAASASIIVGRFTGLPLDNCIWKLSIVGR